MAEYKFINPYNFIPLGNQCHKTPYQKGTYTGYIECVLKTHTPTIIIDSQKGKENKGVPNHIEFKDTFRIGKVPAIPGSELRGVIRNKFETLTQSCLTHIDYDADFYGRYVGNMKQPGLLVYKNNQWELHECIKYVADNPQVVNQLSRMEAGKLVTFEDDIRIGRNNAQTKIVVSINNGSKKGYLRKGEPVAKRKVFHIFVDTGRVVNTKDVPLEALYKKSCKLYKENLGRKHVNETDKDIRPVWYERVGKNFYLSLGENGQAKYYSQMKDVVPHEYLPCNDSKKVCETCSVFGTIQKTKQNQLLLPSKVRISDALLEGPTDNIFVSNKLIILSELGLPKYNNYEFYLKLTEKVDKMLISPDFMTTNDRKRLTTPLYEGDVSIRGRKEYWHFKPDLEKQIDKSRLNRSVQPLKKGLKYTFKIYFNDLTQEELEHLNMSICLGNESDYMHKIGMAKPLGYGSVKIKTTKIMCRQINYVDGKIKTSVEEYIPQNKTIETAFNLTNDQKKAIQHMYSFNYLLNRNDNVVVDYPRKYQNGPIYEWFAKNKGKALPFADKEYNDLILQGEKSGNRNPNNRNNIHYNKGNRNAPKNNYRNKR